jgi:outer membrane protein OmpA-like peptidoglycan-associated protein
MKRIIYILLLAMGVSVVAPVVSISDSSVAAVYAADAKAKAKAAKEKEKAKKQKEREKAKAKAAKEKEKAKKQKAKEQAKAKAQKQKQQEQAKAKSAKSGGNASAKPATAKQQEQNLTAAEEKEQYLAQVAAIDKANAKAVAYNERDIAHRIGFWGLAGYSNLFASNIKYEPATYNAAGDIQTNEFGFRHTDKGFVGGGVGLGYQLRYKRMIMTTGLEFTFYNTVMDIYGKENGYLYRTYGMEPYGATMQYNYAFSEVHEKIIGGFAQVPILFGMELNSRLPLFWQAGIKVGMGVMSSATLDGLCTTTIEDKELISGMNNMYKHSLVTDKDFTGPANKVKFGLNMAASAEFGVYLDPLIRTNTKFRVSVFADYGFINALSFKAAEPASPMAQTDLPMQLLGSDDPLAFPVNAAYASAAAEKAIVNPFLVGVKLALWFNLPRREKSTQKYPKMPTPRMGVYMYDEASAKALGGVAVEITNVETGKHMQKNTNRQGLLQGRFASGQYRVSATKNGYYPSDTVLCTVEDFSFDTLRLPLERIPAPIVYTLCMNVYDAETLEPIESATARMTALSDTVSLYQTMSADDGFIETPLTEGTYIAHMSAVGYMSKDDTLRFVQDTFDIYMQHIKEGIKVKIENLFFATNKTYILPQSKQALADLARFLLDNPTVTIRITGHTDAVGSYEANQILSEGRANAVRTELIKRGVAAERITAEGKGEKEPIADNNTEEGRALNRRVEFMITGTDGEDIQQVFE